MKSNGLFVGLGTGAMRIGLGFKARKIKVVQIGTANLVTVDWNENMARGAPAQAGGIVRAGVANVPGFVVLAQGAGIRMFPGGTLPVAAATLADQVYCEAVPAYQASRQASIVYWTQGNAAKLTGNFDQALAAECGVGSQIEVRGADGLLYDAYIQALTNRGTNANEVTLDRPVPSGKVKWIGCSVDYVPLPAGFVMPAGFEIQDTTYANLAQTVFAFEAED